eukprot:gene11462-13548_t
MSENVRREHASVARAVANGRDHGLSNPKDETGAEERIPIPNLVAVLIDLASEAGEIIRKVTASGDLGVKDKGGSTEQDGIYFMDAQTESDRQAESMLVTRLLEYFPSLQLVAEESSEQALDTAVESLHTKARSPLPPPASPAAIAAASELWPLGLQRPLHPSRVVVFIDPLDGTNEYARGERVNVTCLLGVAVDGVPVAGVIGQPFHSGGAGRVVWGGPGIGVHGCEMGEATWPPFAVAINRDLKDDLLPPVMTSLDAHIGLQVSATGSHFLALLEGRAHSLLLLRRGSKKWDSCAGEALLRAVGGSVTDAVGRRYAYSCHPDTFQNLCGLAASRHADVHRHVMATSRHLASQRDDGWPYSIPDRSIRQELVLPMDAEAPNRRSGVSPPVLVIDAFGPLLEPAEPVASVCARVVAARLGVQASEELISSRLLEAFGSGANSEATLMDVAKSEDGREAEAAALRFAGGSGGAAWSIAGAGAFGVPQEEDPLTMELLEALWENYGRPEAWRPVQGAAAALAELKAAGVVVVAVACNRDALRVRKLLGVIGDADTLDAIAVMPPTADVTETGSKMTKVGEEPAWLVGARVQAALGELRLDAAADVGRCLVVCDAAARADESKLGGVVRWAPGVRGDSVHSWTELVDVVMSRKWGESTEASFWEQRPCARS